jgi:nitroreductase
MDALEAILSRRSIRRYTGQPVSGEQVEELLKAGMSAPSAGNQQPWQFIVITDRKLLAEIPRFHPYASMLPHAKVAILVCGDLQAEWFQGYWVQDCSAATENILIAAHAMGLGAVWLGIYPREERVKALQKLLNLPEHIVPLSLISIGYPAEKKPPADRFDPSRIHHNGW